MARYIDADAYEYPGDLINVPTADVAEVKHARWDDSKFVKIGGVAGDFPSVECTNCGSIFCDIINNHNYMYHYCPHCGAKMDGGKEE